MLRPALPANGDLDRNGLPLISRLIVLSAIHCSTGFTLDTSEVYLSYINQCRRNARHVPKPWWRRWWWEGCGDGKSCRMKVGLWVGGWRGRVRGDHSRPYPLSCFMATVLNGTRTSITASRHSEPSDSGRCRQKSCVDSRRELSQERLLSLTFDHLSSTAQDTAPQSDT